MNELRKRWLEALRSGKYEQGTDALRREEKFCCLGVLCDIYDPSGWKGVSEGLIGGNRIHIEGSHTLPAKEVMDAVGLNAAQASGLAGMNDRGTSFTVIAHELEAIFKATP